jgi:hypothetical protein
MAATSSADRRLSAMRAEGRVVNDFESDYVSYENAKDSEGGLHSGRKTPSWRFLWTVAFFLATIIAGVIALALIPNR